MELSKSEISAILDTYFPVFHAAARHVCAVRAAELRDEIAYAWWAAYCKKPEASLRVFEQSDSGVFVWARWRAMEIVRRWLRDEEESLDAILDSVEDIALSEPEWGFAPQTERGKREHGDYIADESDLHRLFEACAKRSDLETPDLMDAFHSASPAKQVAIRKLASGFAQNELGTWGYESARKQLQAAAL